MRRLAVVFRAAALILLAIVVALSASFLAARTGLFDGLIVDAFKSRIAEAGIDLKMDGFSFDPAEFNFSANNFNARGPGDSWALETGRISITWHPVASLSGETTLSLLVEKPRITGKYLAAPGGVKDGGASSFSLSKWALHKVKITDGSVDLAFPEYDARLALDRIEVDWLEKRGKGTIGEGSVTWKGERETLLEASFEGDRKIGDTRIEPFYLRTTRLSATGGLRVGLLDRLGGEFNLRADLRDLPKKWLDALHLSHFDPVGCKVDLLGQLGGSLSSPVLGCELEISEGRFGPMTIRSIAGNADLSEKGARFRKFAVVTSAGAARGVEGRIDFGKSVTIEAEAEADGYDLRRSMDLLGMVHFPVGLFASGKVGAKGELYPKLSLDCEGEKVRVREFAVSTIHQGKERTWYSADSATVDFSARVMAEGIDFGKCFVDAGSVEVSVKKGHINYHEGLEYDTAVKINSLETVRRYLPEGFDATGTADGRFGGPYRKLKFDYALDFSSVKVFGKEIGKARAKASYDLETLNVSEMSLDGPVARGEVRGKAVLLPGGDFDLTASLSNGNMAEGISLIAAIGKFRRPEFLSGAFSAEGGIAGKIGSPEFTGKVDLSGVEVAPSGSFKGAVVDSARISGAFGLKSWRAEDFEFKALGASFKGSGLADLDSFSVSASVDSLSLDRVKETVGSKAEISGTFSGAVKAGGRYASPGYSASGILSGFTVAGVAAGDLETRIESSDGKFGINASRLDKTAKISATVDKTGLYTAEVEFDRLTWEALPSDKLPEGLKARLLNGKGRATGLLGGPGGFELRSAKWDGSATDVHLGENFLGELLLTAAYPADTPDTVRLEAGLWGGQARVFTLFSPKGSFSPSVGLALDSLDLTRLRTTAPAIEGGTVDLKATVLLDQVPPKAKDVKGILREIREFKADGKASGLKVRGVPPIGKAVFQAGGSGGDWWLAGDAPPFGKIGGKLSTSDFAWELAATLDSLDPVAFFPDYKDKIKARIDGPAKVSGVLGAISEISGSGRIYGVEAYGVGPRSGAWKAATLPGSGNKPGGAELTLTLDGGIAAAVRLRYPENAIDAKVTATDVKVEEWLSKEKIAKGWSGRFSGAADFSLSPRREFEATARLTALAVDTPNGKIGNRGDVVFSYRNGRVIFDDVELASSEVEGKVTGSLKPFGNYNLKIDALLDLGRMAKKLPRVEDASGKAHFSGTVAGEWEKPKIAGRLEIRQDAEVKVEKLAYSFKKMTAQGEISLPGELRIESVEASFGEGKVHAEGRVGFKDYAPESIDLLISAKHISYEYPKGASYTFDGEFMLAGPFSQLELRGEARLLEFLYTKQIRWRTATLSMLERAKKARVGTKETGDVYIDVAVLGNRNLRVENNLANLELGADVRIRGYLPTPQIWGRVDVNTGSVRFRAREYKLLRSNIEFLGDNAAVAVVDGRAVTTVGEYTINVSASGPIEDIKVDLSSLPPLPRTDIVALLALGTTSEHLEKSEAVTAFEATNILTGSLQDELEGQAYDVFGIDQFQVNPSYSKQAQSTVPRITVGKSVANSIFARYSADIGSGQGQEVSLEYALKPGIVFLGSWYDEGTTESGSFGAELRFRYTFR